MAKINRFHVLLVISFLFVILACYYLKDTAYSIIIALVLAYAFSPVIDYFEKKKVHRVVSSAILVLLVVIIVSFAVILLLPVAVDQLKLFITEVPAYFGKLLDWLVGYLQSKGISVPLGSVDLIEELKKSAMGIRFSDISPWSKFGIGILHNVFVIFSKFLNVLILLVFFFFFLVEIKDLKQRILDLTPKGFQKSHAGIAERINGVLHSYIRGQLLVVTCMACIYSIILTSIGIKFSLVIGLLSGFLGIVPYMGIFTGFLLSMFAVFIDVFAWQHFIGVLITYSVFPFIDGFFVTPKVVGNKVGLTTLESLFAILLGGSILGFWGLLIAIPIGGAIKLIVGYIIQLYYEGRKKTQPITS